jgi:hypothetical protein
MKVRHLFVFAFVLALVTLATSCDKDKTIANKITGTWNLNNVSYRDSDNEDWTDSITADENIAIEFCSDGSFNKYKDNVADGTGHWEYHSGFIYLRDETNNVSFAVEECTKTYMEWHSKSEKWEEGELTYWREQLWSWKK